jgi:hypothetical protein
VSTTLGSQWLQPNPEVAQNRYAVPSLLLRCAMFSARSAQGKTGRTIYNQPKQRASQGKIGVRQRPGTQLVQSDADVYFELLRRVLAQPRPEKNDSDSITIKFSASEFLRSIKRSTGAHDIAWLRRTVGYLYDAEYELRFPTRAPALSSRLLRSGLIDPCENDTRFSVQVSRDLALLYEKGWTVIEPEIRLALRKDPVAQWLHSFFCTHTG